MDHPERVGRYRVLEPLAQGGSAVVYAAEDERDGSPAAVKIPHRAASPVHLAWFRREAALAARLSHPGIVRLLHAGTLEAGRPYLVFERIDGPTLEQIADELSGPAIVSVGVQLLDALGYAHDAGVVHCDVKPDNVLVSAWEGGGHPLVELADFGLAATREPSAEQATGLPVVAGTPGYLSPEQARGAQRLAPASDLYACGAVLYRLIAGFPPHIGGSTHEVLRHTLEREPLPMRPRDGLELAPALLGVVHDMLARDPHARPASAFRARRALLDAAGVSVASVTPAFPLDRRELSSLKRSYVTRAQQEQTSAPADPEGATVAVSETRRPALTPQHALGRYLGRRAALVGRGEALEALERTLGPEGDGAIARVLGPPGVGRSRLLEEATRALAEQGVPVWRVTGRRGVRSPPFEVLAALALDVIGAADASPPWVAAERLAHALTDAGIGVEDAGRDALVSGLVGVGLPTTVGQVRLHVYRALSALLRRHGRGTHPVLAVDDADEADEDSLAVLERLSVEDSASAEQAWAPRIVLSLREPSEPLEPATRFADVRLEPLGPGDAARMLAELLEVSPDAVEAEARSCGGIPADAAELARARLGRSSAGPRAGPATLTERVERMPERIRRVLEAAAIHEGDVPVRSIAAMASGLGRDDIDAELAGEALDRLMLDELLVRPFNPAGRLERTLRFGSETLRRWLRKELPDDRARRLHAAAAQWIGRESHDGSHGMRAALAAHAEAAGDDAAAGFAHAEAGRMGAVIGDPRATEHLSKALTLARSSPEAAAAVDEPAVLAQLARQASQRGEPETAELLAREGLERIEDGRGTLRARLWRLLGEAHRHRHHLDEALAALDEALAALGPHGDPMERAWALGAKGWILGYLAGRNDEGIALGHEALEVAGRIDAPSFRASLCGQLGANLLRAGDWDGQLAINHQDLGLAVQARDFGGVIRANINIGVCYTNRGLPGLARAHTERAAALSRRFGHRVAELIAMSNLAMLAADEERWEDAERLATEAVQMAERCDIRAVVGEARCTLARVHLARGELEKAEEDLRAALEGSEGAADRELALRLRGLVRAAGGEPAAAREVFEALLAEDEPDPYERASTRIAFASALRAARDETGAAAQERRADLVYERLGADPEHERRRWRVPDLRGGPATSRR